MATPIIMPRQGQSVESCILTEWKVEVGHEVAEGDVLAVIETDKASFDLESTASGKVLALFWEADDDVPVWRTSPPLEKRGKTSTTYVRLERNLPRHPPRTLNLLRVPAPRTLPAPQRKLQTPNHRISRLRDPERESAHEPERSP